MAVSLWLPVPNDPTADIYGTPAQELLSKELGMNRTDPMLLWRSPSRQVAACELWRKPLPTMRREEDTEVRKPLHPPNFPKSASEMSSCGGLLVVLVPSGRDVQRRSRSSSPRLISLKYPAMAGRWGQAVQPVTSADTRRNYRQPPTRDNRSSRGNPGRRLPTVGL